MNRKKIVLSGIRPTAGLHLGNILGAVENMVKLQNLDEYECYYFIADYHAATTNPAFSTIRENSLEVLADMISCGLNPEKSVIFRQSDIPELPQLHLIFSYLITVSELERNPVYKEQKQELHLNGNGLSSFLLYPVLQAADICLYKGAFIPVGKDQVPHIEITREIARRANTLCNREIFPLPEALLTEMPKIPGIDGRKMSKSYSNFIALSDSPEETKEKVFQMVTDVKKPRLSDPGHPDECNLYQLMKCYENGNTFVQIKEDCKEGKIGCRKVCKPLLSQVLNEALSEPRKIRNELINDNNGLENVLKKGAEKARNKALETVKEVRTALGFSVRIEDYCQE
ncbi:MAG: tryptophan--tRNA ligase [Patescibacteria group bacterium]|nr:tryptophan--tRNA ligase [Patescibacteria group bacterium]